MPGSGGNGCHVVKVVRNVELVIFVGSPGSDLPVVHEGKTKLLPGGNHFHMACQIVRDIALVLRDVPERFERGVLVNPETVRTPASDLAIRECPGGRDYDASTDNETECQYF
jgi:hypothetical protein